MRETGLAHYRNCISFPPVLAVENNIYDEWQITKAGFCTSSWALSKNLMRFLPAVTVCTLEQPCALPGAAVKPQPLLKEPLRLWYQSHHSCVCFTS